MKNLFSLKKHCNYLVVKLLLSHLPSWRLFPVKKGERTWRLNPYFIYLDYNDAGDLQLYQFSLFPLLPSISYERTF